MGNFKPFREAFDRVVEGASKIPFGSRATNGNLQQAKPSGIPFVNPEVLPPINPPASTPNVSVPKGYRANPNGQVDQAPQFGVTRPLRQRIDPAHQGWTGGNSDFMRSRPGGMRSADPSAYPDSVPSNTPSRPVQPEILGMPKPAYNPPAGLPQVPKPVVDPTDNPVENAVRQIAPWLLPFKGVAGGAVGALADILLNPQPTGNLDPKFLFPGFDPLNAEKLPQPQGRSPNGTPRPPKPGDPGDPGVPRQPGSSNTVYRVTYAGYRSEYVRTNPAWYGSNGNVPIYQFVRWVDPVSGSLEMQGPISVYYRPANPTVMSYYDVTPSTYDQVVLTSQTTGASYTIISASGYLAYLSTLQFQRLDELPEPYEIPPRPPTPPIPFPQPPVIDQPKLDDPVNVQGGSSPKMPPFAVPSNLPSQPGKKNRNRRVGAPLPPGNKKDQPDKNKQPSPSDPTKKNPDKPPYGNPSNNPGKTPGTPPNPVPGDNKKPGIAGSPCVPRGQKEPMTCKYNPKNDQDIQEILKRIGKPNAPGGLTAVIGGDQPRHPVTKLPTNLVGMSKLNFLMGMVSTVFAPFNFIFNVHNAFMLSADIKETVGSFMSITLDVVRTALSLKDPDDGMIDLNDIINKNFESMMDNLLGASNWELIKKRAAAVNRIYMASTNVMHSIQNGFESIFDSVGTIGQYTGQIGNALKQARVVYEDAYDWMSESAAGDVTIRGRFRNFNQRLEGVEDAANMLVAIASSVQQTQEAAKELADSLTEYEKAKKAGLEAFTKEYAEKNKADKASQAPDSLAEVELKTFDYEDD